jgi:hypothetical protein
MSKSVDVPLTKNSARTQEVLRMLDNVKESLDNMAKAAGVELITADSKLTSFEKQSDDSSQRVTPRGSHR